MHDQLIQVGHRFRRIYARRVRYIPLVFLHLSLARCLVAVAVLVVLLAIELLAVTLGRIVHKVHHVPVTGCLRCLLDVVQQLVIVDDVVAASGLGLFVLATRAVVVEVR